jgi:uncharacterized protein YecE (DUF72 family)
MAMARIRIGTASWTDPGFVADWYPPKLSASRRLPWYAGHFNYVEVNSTFYAIPAAKTVERWCHETPSGFLFDLKLPKALSRHAMDPKFLPPDLRPKVSLERGKVKLSPATEQLITDRFLQETAPLKHASKLGALLLQLSPSFGPNEHELAEFDSLWSHLSGYTVSVELRNRHWTTDGQFADTIDYFKTRRLTLVLVDGPQSEHFSVLPAFDCITNPALGYLRLHGRNEQGYIRGRSVAERFDYDYGENEIQEIAARIRKLEKEVDEIHIVANNNRSNFAPKLAARLQQLLGLKEALQTALAEQQGKLF